MLVAAARVRARTPIKRSMLRMSSAAAVLPPAVVSVGKPMKRQPAKRRVRSSLTRGQSAGKLAAAPAVAGAGTIAGALASGSGSPTKRGRGKSGSGEGSQVAKEAESKAGGREESERGEAAQQAGGPAGRRTR